MDAALTNGPKTETIFLLKIPEFETKGFPLVDSGDQKRLKKGLWEAVIFECFGGSYLYARYKAMVIELFNGLKRALLEGTNFKMAFEKEAEWNEARLKIGKLFTDLDQCIVHLRVDVTEECGVTSPGILYPTPECDDHHGAPLPDLLT
jgi:hypothetical protein